MSRILSQELSQYLNISIETKDPVLAEMERLALEKGIPILERSSAAFLEQLIYIYNPKKFLEIGTAIGYSTIRAAKILKNSAEISSIELSQANVKIAKTFFEKAGLSDNINLIEGDAKEFLSKTNKKYDFIFLDADKEDYPEFFDLCMDRLTTGGVFLVDNLLWKGYVISGSVPFEHKKSTELIKQFNAQFLNHPNLKSSIIPLGDGIGLGIKV